MKFGLFLAVASLAAAVQAAPALSGAADPNPVSEIVKRDPAPAPRWAHRFCWLPGQSCSRKVKRAPTALPGPEPNPDPRWAHRFCWLPGQSCSKVKRSAMPDPNPSPDPRWAHRFCWLPGQSCSRKVRRDETNPEGAQQLPPSGQGEGAPVGADGQLIELSNDDAAEVAELAYLVHVAYSAYAEGQDEVSEAASAAYAELASNNGIKPV